MTEINNCCWQRCISVIVYWLSLTVRVLLAMYWHFRGGRYYYYQLLFFVLACLDAFLVSELCLSPPLFLQIKVSVEPFVVGLEFAVANFLIVQVKKIKIIAELTILKARCKNLQFTCAILIVSSRQNCRGHIMHHHDTFHKMLSPPA